MHPDYVDELIWREQHHDWQRDQEQARLARTARSGRANHSGLGRAIVKWLDLRFNTAPRRTRPAAAVRPKLALKR